MYICRGKKSLMYRYAHSFMMKRPQLGLGNLFSHLYNSGNIGPSHQDVVKVTDDYKESLTSCSSYCLNVLNCY